MESKITIHTGDDFKPVIKVVEKESDDVRDVLLRQMRGILNHQSRTFTIEFLGVPENEKINAAYYISPVEDEITYSKQLIRMRINTHLLDIKKAKEVIKKIDDFYDYLNVWIL